MINCGERIVRKKEEGNIYPVFGGGDETFRADKYNRENQVIISRFGMSPKCVRYVSGKFFLNDSGFTIKSLDINKIINEFVDILMFSIQDTIYSCGRGPAQKNIDFEMFNNIKIPRPPKNIQEKIVEEIKKLENEKEGSKKNIDELKKDIKEIVSNNSKEEKLDNIKTMLSRGKSPKYGTSNVQIIKSGQARGYKEFDFPEKHYVSGGFIIDERKLEKGDILINSSGVGTAGRVTLFNLDGDFVVDSHISILRLNKTKANPDYVLYSLANIGFKTIEAMAMGQSGQIELSQTTIKNIKIPLPNISEQNKIVKQIEKLETDISKLETQINKIPDLKREVLRKYL